MSIPPVGYRLPRLEDPVKSVLSADSLLFDLSRHSRRGCCLRHARHGCAKRA
jgi:hypothetical protein